VVTGLVQLVKGKLVGMSAHNDERASNDSPLAVTG
jgi:hypothetical protein